MLESFFQAWGNIVQPVVFLSILAASLVAVILGVIPAISGPLLCIMLLPFVFGMEPLIALPIMCTLMSVSTTGGSITAVLMGIPGDTANAATILDGFPMTRNGQGGRALGLALGSNMTGGIVAIFLSFAVIPILIPIIMAFKTPEMFLIVLLALSFLNVLTGKSKLKGLISGGLGILMACVGFQANTGLSRFTFGNMYLYDGIDAATTLLAVLAMPILIELSVLGETIAPAGMGSSGKFREIFKGVAEVFRRHKWLWLRSVAIGYIIGIIPALGGATSQWLCYGQAKQSSKEPDKFGTGCPEGIIAAESSNNSCHAGDLLTTLAFGIPGSSIMVVLLAAFVLMGIQPGPKMLITHTTLCFTMLAAVGLANIFAGTICLFGSPILIKVTRISPVYLFAFLIPIIFISAYVSRGYTIDLFVFAILSLIGILFSRFGFSAPSFILGFILGGMAEQHFILSLNIYGPIFMFTSPISIVLVCLTIVTLFLEPMIKIFNRMFKLNAKRTN